MSVMTESLCVETYTREGWVMDKEFSSIWVAKDYIQKMGDKHYRINIYSYNGNVYIYPYDGSIRFVKQSNK